MSRFARTYDVEEANAALPEVRRLVRQIVEVAASLPDLEDQVRIARYRAQRPDATGDERDDVEVKEGALAGAERDLGAAAIRLEELGVQLKDARSGLVDFPSLREGEVVELCWKLGEDRVAHWHRIGEGYAGRKPL